MWKWIWQIYYSVIHSNQTCTSVGFLFMQVLLSFAANAKGNVLHVNEKTWDATLLVVDFVFVLVVF